MLAFACMTLLSCRNTDVFSYDNIGYCITDDSVLNVDSDVHSLSQKWIIHAVIRRFYFGNSLLEFSSRSCLMFFNISNTPVAALSYLGKFCLAYFLKSCPCVATETT